MNKKTQLGSRIASGALRVAGATLTREADENTFADVRGYLAWLFAGASR